MRLMGFLCFIIFVVGVGTNGLVMLISPRMWFRLPFWMRASGSLRKEKYGSGWGAIEIRIVGAVALGVVIWFVYSFVSGA
jgi:hypothetical protein